MTDTFGVTTSVRPEAHPDSSGRPSARRDRWTKFTLTDADIRGRDTDVADMFVLPSSAPHRLTSTPLEEVLLLRGKMANLAWAV